MIAGEWYRRDRALNMSSIWSMPILGQKFHRGWVRILSCRMDFLLTLSMSGGGSVCVPSPFSITCVYFNTQMPDVEMC